MTSTIPHLPAGTLLGGGKYRIVRFIGAGGFGCTYEAEFVPMNSRVAVKEFFVSSFCNRDATGAISVGASSQAALVGKLEEKFRIEAQRLFSLKHPGIVGVSDILQERGTSYYVMDFISGQSLQEIIDQRGPLPEGQALKYIGQVMDALQYVHAKSVLHLDIKPDNIMIDADDNAVLIDFGVSKQYDEANGHNTSTILGQTPGYAPPEQVGNSIRMFTPAADIYALGATLYCALTGSVPPSSPDLISGMAHLQPLPAGTSPSTHRAIATMMQPNANRRPQSIADARALLADAPQAPQPPIGGVSVDTATQPLSATADSGKSARIGIGLCLLAIFGSFLMSLISGWIFNRFAHYVISNYVGIFFNCISIAALTIMAFNKKWFKSPAGQVGAGIFATLTIYWTLCTMLNMWFEIDMWPNLSRWRGLAVNLCINTLEMIAMACVMLTLKTNKAIKVSGMIWVGFSLIIAYILRIMYSYILHSYYSYSFSNPFSKLTPIYSIQGVSLLIIWLLIVIFTIVWMCKKPKNEQKKAEMFGGLGNNR